MLLEMVAGFIQDVVCYHVGLGFLRIVTFGRYPPKEPTDNEKSKAIASGWIVMAGLITVLWLALK
jgi:hypothetical protein